VLSSAGVAVVPYHDVHENPDADAVARAASFAREAGVGGFVGLGGGSSMDTAKAANLLSVCGGSAAAYRGYGKATAALLPMIGVPTTAGTGSEAQSYALVSDAATHEKMAIGDPGLAFRVAILDPDLLVSVPRRVAAASGFDAIAHAVETIATTRRNAVSDAFAREAFRLLSHAFRRHVLDPRDAAARADMLLGAHLAGRAIEASMLGAAHACANPLTARLGAAHGEALAVVLPHVVRFNRGEAASAYMQLVRAAGWADAGDPAVRLATWLEDTAQEAGLPASLGAFGDAAAALDQLAAEAAAQWTGRFNPRPFDAAAAREIYRCAL
jgi:alcohol dehydrogenase